MESWEKYGFPDPHLATPYYPFVGLVKALNERRELSGGKPYDIPEFFQHYATSAHGLLNSLDAAIMNTGETFINPDKFDLLTDSSPADSMRYTMQDLLLIGAEGIEENIISPSFLGFTHLVPSWSAEYAIQRYRIINAMRYKRIYDISIVNGSYTSGRGSTITEAYNDFLSKYPEEIRTFSYPEAFTSPYTDSNSSSFTVWYFDRVETSIGHDAWFVTYAKTNSSNAGVFYSFGSGITPGWNRIKADRNGVFFRQEYPPPMAKQGWSSTLGNSWGYGYYAYADFNDTFNFKEVSA